MTECIGMASGMDEPTEWLSIMLKWSSQVECPLEWLRSLECLRLLK
jgi:hypothetical protein